MQYALLIYENETVYGPGKDNAAFREIVAKHMAFSEELGAVRKGGVGLKGSNTATTLRSKGGARTVHDGPFAEGKEQLGGFYLVETADLDAAIAIAKKLPLIEGGAIEIRPVLGGPPPR
ncbi:MAG: YciI family protein [Myxococcota bacterium]|nr:YciI family protein [Myxococcota bacterium]